MIFIAALLLSCRENPKSIQSGSGDEAFQKLSDEFISGYLAWRPEFSVYLGFHEYDGKTSDLRKESIENELARLKSYDQILNQLDTALLSPGMYYDFRILQSGIRNEIFNIEDVESYTKNIEEVTSYTKNPMSYANALDVSTYIKRNFSPLEDRLRSIITIENKAPEIFAVAKSNLADSLAKPLIETAIQIVKGYEEFLEGDLIIAFKEVKNDSLMAVFQTANKKAIFELKEYAEYLEKEKLPKAHNNYALGRDKYQKMLLYGEGISISPERILEIGLAELEKEKNVFNSAAKIINPNKKPIEVYHDLQKEHPISDSLISEVKKNVEGIHHFLVGKKIISIPSEVRVQVKETPKYNRYRSTASLDPPMPFEMKATESYYYITPVDPKWTLKQKEDWLSLFNYYYNVISTIHEVYPGHYTQFLHLKTSSATKIEKIFWSYAFVDGWAHYTEKMMIDEGYGNTGDPIITAKYRLAQSSASLLRLCRLCVSIKMHCEGMSVDDATKFFMDNWYPGEKPSRQEAIRGIFDPGYLYFSLGKLMILKLREDYQKQEGANFSLQKFHDQLLDNGMPPIRLLRERLLKDKNKWDKII